MIFGRKKAADPTEDPKDDAAQLESGDESQTSETSDKKEDKKAGSKAEKKSKGNDVKRDRNKAMTFFRHASTVAEARNYDYSIQLFMDGFSHDPDNMNMHEQLREVALRRKVSGGKRGKFFDKWKGRGKSKIEKALQAE